LVGIVQVKRYDPGTPLPPAFIQEIYGVKAHLEVQFAYLVTTARFSPESRKLAKVMDIRLIDGSNFEEKRAEVIPRTAGWQPLRSSPPVALPSMSATLPISQPADAFVAAPQISIVAPTRPIF